MKSFLFIRSIALATCAAFLGCDTAPQVGDGDLFTEEQMQTFPTEHASGSQPPRADGYLFTEEQASGSWPVWRGPHGDGISRETDWRWDWSDKLPQLVWTAHVGTGYSSVAIDEGRLYTMGRIGQNEDPKDDDDAVYCFDAHSGESVWTHRYACDLADNLHFGGPGATPTVDGDRLYTLSREGHIFCLDAENGEVVWSRFVPDDFGVKQPEWGFTASPLIVGDRVLLQVGRTVALNKRTGEVIWQGEEFKPGYGSLTLYDNDGTPCLAVLNNDFLLLLQAESGSELARYQWKTDHATNSTTPIVWRGTFFVSTGYNRGCTLLHFVQGELEPVYENKTMRNHFNNSVLYNGMLYGIDGNSHASRQCKLVCMDYETGEEQWIERGFGCGSLLIAAGKLIILADDGWLVTAEATSEGYQEISRFRALDEGDCWSVPVLLDGRIYCRNSQGDLVCVDVRR